MEIIDKLNYVKIMSDLKSNLHISAKIVVATRSEYVFVMNMLKDLIGDDPSIVMLSQHGLIRNISVGSRLAVSSCRNANDVWQSVAGGVFDCIYASDGIDTQSVGVLTSRIRRPQSMPSIDGLSGLFLYKDL